MHIAKVYYFSSAKQLDSAHRPKPVRRWFYKGDDLFNAYDTRQAFVPEYINGVDMSAFACYVPRQYLNGDKEIEQLQEEINKIKQVRTETLKKPHIRAILNF